MCCLLCDKKSIGSIKLGVFDYDYCDKHQRDIMIAVSEMEEDSKALDKLIKKYKGKKK